MTELGANPTSAGQSIGPNGGHVDGPNGASVDIPQGALANPVAIRISSPSSGYPALPSSSAPLSAVLSFEPHGQIFATAVTITIPYSGNAAMIRALTAEPQGSWSVVANVTTANGAAQIKSPHFSFMIILPPDESTSSTASSSTAASSSSGGSCVQQPCPPNMVSCGNCCFDLSNDPLNCGTCNHACLPAHNCKYGVCQ